MGPRSVLPAAALAAMLAALLAAGPASSRQPHQPARAEILVGFEPGVAASTQLDLVTRLGAVAEERFRPIRVLLASVPAKGRDRVIAALERDPRVRYAEPNVRFHVDELPNDSSFAQLWGLDNSGQAVNGLAGRADADIDATEAWAITTGSPDVTVGVIDTGVDYSHPDLAANIWINPGEDCAGCRNDGIDNDANGFVDDWHGWDFINNDNDPYDDNGHGTHVAGTIGAVGDNGQGVAGVNWNVKLMPLKFIGANGSGDASDAVRAVLYASAMGAEVTNNSWGGDGYSQALGDAIAEADAQGSLFVAAAGNSFTNTDASPNYPSGYDLPNVIAVAATDQNDARAWFSNYGRRSVDLGAPGTNILSTQPGASYQFLDGTSMAAPHVAGAAALVRAASPSASDVGLKALLFRTVDANTSLAGKTTTGGRLNVGRAVACAGAPQLWLDAPAPAFSLDVGQTLPVRIFAGRCGDPAGVTVDATVNGSPIALAGRGDGLYVGSFTATEPGGITVQATATAAAGTDVQTAVGSATQVYPIVPGGDPVTVTTTAPEENARLAFDGAAAQRISLKLTNVTIGTSGYASAKVSILKPDGSSLVAPTYFGTSGGFVDTKTLPVQGRYTIIIDPQSSATGSVTLTLFDVPPDVSASISAGGPNVTVAPEVPGQNARLTFTGAAGQRISLKLTNVTIGTSGFSSAKVSILKPDGSSLVAPTYFGTSGGFVDLKTLPVAGTYVILVDPQSNAVGEATLTLYDVPPDATGSIVPGGSDATVALTVPGQNGRLTFSGTAGQRVSLRLTNVSIGPSGSASAKVSISTPSGGTLVAPTYFGTNGGFVDLTALPATGAYTILIDPQSNSTGGATATPYDVPPDASASLAVGGSSATLSMGVPGQNGSATFTGAAGQGVTLRLTNVTIGPSGFSSAKVSILKPDGATLLSPTYFGTSGKTLALQLPANGEYRIVLDPQSFSTGNATLALTSP
jgi:Subtilase family/Fervidolysin N-terminal prodomain